MPSYFKLLLEKEIKDLLRDPKMIIGMIVLPIIMFSVMGYTMKVSFTAIKEAALKPRVAVLDFDGGEMAQMLIKLLESTPGAKVEVLDVSSINEALSIAQEKDLPVIMVIPEEFTESINSGIQAKVEIYTIFKSLSMAEMGKASTPTSVVRFLNDYLVNEFIKKAFPDRDPNSVLNPIISIRYSIIKGKVVNVPPEAIMGIIQSQSMTMPLTVMMVLVFAMQIAATSIAIEKEEKTLETLLTLPVNRLSILASKLLGSVIVAAIGSSVYLIGYTYYISSVTSFNEFTGVQVPSAEALGLTITPLGFMLLGISLFLAITSSLAMAITVASFTEDVRSAQTVVGYLYIPVFIPSFILMFIDIKSLPIHLQFILYAIPFTHPILATKAAILEDYMTIILGIIYVLALTIAILYITAKLFTTEKILTMRISFKKFKLKRS